MDVTTLVTRLSPPLLSYCRAHTHCPARAEETAQDALTVLVERYRRNDPPDDPAAFVFTIARRRLRRRLWWQRVRLPLDAAPEPVTATPDPEQRSVLRERLRRVDEALGRLRPGEREALLLAVVGGLDAAAGARRLGISPAAFRMRTHRARRRLAVWLGALGLVIAASLYTRPGVERAPGSAGAPTSTAAVPATPVTRELVGSGDALTVRPAGSILLVRTSQPSAGGSP